MVIVILLRFSCATNHKDLRLKIFKDMQYSCRVTPLAPNEVYICPTAELTYRRCILNIYSTNTLTEYFKHAAHSPFFALQDAVYFIMLPFLVPVIFTF